LPMPWCYCHCWNFSSVQFSSVHFSSLHFTSLHLSCWCWVVFIHEEECPDINCLELLYLQLGYLFLLEESYKKRRALLWCPCPSIM
jgi:hypothetical protein